MLPEKLFFIQNIKKILPLHLYSKKKGVKIYLIKLVENAMIGATLCFVKYKENILLINRNKPPFMGMWNAIGGHLEKGESPRECAIREIYEESGLKVKDVELISVFTWNYDDEIGLVYLCELNDDFDLLGFNYSSSEGIICFKPIDWIVNPKNFGVVEDLKVFIEDIKKGHKNNYHMVYQDKKLISAQKKQFSTEILQDIKSF